MSPSRNRRLSSKLSLAAAIGLVFALVAAAMPASALVIGVNGYPAPAGLLPTQTVVSPDSRYAFTVTATPVPGSAATIEVFDMTARAYVSSITLTGHVNGWGIAISPDGHTLYATTNGDFTTVAGGVSRIDVSNPLNPVETGFLPMTFDPSTCPGQYPGATDSPVNIVINHAGTHLYVIGRSSNALYDINLAQFDAGAAAIAQAAVFAQDDVCGNGYNILYELAVAANDSTIFVTESSTMTSPQISRVFALSTAQFPSGIYGEPGSDTFPELTLPAGFYFDIPDAIAASPDGKWLYVANTQLYSGGVVTYGNNYIWEFDQATGAFVNAFEVTDPNEPGNSNMALAVSPDSSQLVVVDGHGFPNFTFISTADLSVSFTQALQNSVPPGFTMFSRDGAHVVTSSATSAALNILDLDPAYPLVIPELAKTGVDGSPVLSIALVGLLAGFIALAVQRGRSSRVRARSSR